MPASNQQRCRVNVIGAKADDMVTADDIANQLQFLLKTKWTLDKDTYNSDAFDQCEGAWPIDHPLPLPLWSNNIKQPYIVENVSKKNFRRFFFKLEIVSILILIFFVFFFSRFFFIYRFGNMKT